jgi:hypothetical protein
MSTLTPCVWRSNHAYNRSCADVDILAVEGRSRSPRRQRVLAELSVLANLRLRGTFGVGRENDPVGLRSGPEQGHRNVAIAVVGCPAGRERMRSAKARLPRCGNQASRPRAMSWEGSRNFATCDRALPARVTGRCWITPGAVTPERLPLRPKLDNAGASASLLLRRRAPVSRDCWPSRAAATDSATAGRPPGARRPAEMPRARSRQSRRSSRWWRRSPSTSRDTRLRSS